VTEQPTPTRGLPLITRVRKLRITGGSGIVGTAELIALGGSALVAVLVVISYLYFLVPARTKLQTAEAERARLQAFLGNYRSEVRDEQTTESTVRSITDSLDRFESEQLFSRTQGRMDLYGELNLLIRKNALRNTSGPSYTALEPAGTKNTGATSKSANSKWQSIYPGIAITVTVEGQYANLRRFIHDIEASKLFVIINAVELERADTSSSTAAQSEGSQRTSLVSLRLDMATYFQRSSADGTSGQLTTH